MKAVIILCGLMIFITCIDLDDDQAWNNVLDQNGTTFKRPVVAAMADTTVSINDSVHIYATGIMGNAPIDSFIWSFDDGLTWNALDDTVIRFFRTEDTAQPHIIIVKVTDSLDISSYTDTVTIFVKTFPPSLDTVADIKVSVTDSVVLNVSASDSNKTRSIAWYYWDIGADGWNDSTIVPQYVFKNPSGGWMQVRWGVHDDDMLWAMDTFAIRYNQLPMSLVMHEPSQNDTAKFIAFDLVNLQGSVHFLYGAVDPDGFSDSLTYTLYLGKSPQTLTQIYQGRDTVYTKNGLDTLTAYHWKLHVSDLYGDSAVKSGSFYTPEIDLDPPIITLLGQNPIYLSLREPFTEPGATAYDSIDGDVTGSISISGSVNNLVAGKYTITYWAKDMMNNEDSIQRTVIVEEYLVLENFESGPSYQTTFGAYFSTGASDSVGYWKWWNERSSSEPPPNETDSSFEDIITPQNGANNTAGFMTWVDAWWPPSSWWGFSFFLKKRGVYYDLSELDSITFFAKRNAEDTSSQIRIQCSYGIVDSMNLPDSTRWWGYIGKDITLTQQWKRFCIKPADLKGIQSSVAQNHTWDTAKKSVTALQFLNAYEVEERGRLHLYLDDIRLYGKFSNHAILQ